MKKVLIMLFLCVIGLACKDKIEPVDTVEITEPPIITEPEIKIDTVAYATKEPFVEINDRGLEAYLVINKYDTDNQINGRISMDDMNKVEFLNISGSSFKFLEGSDIQKSRYDYIIKKYDIKILDIKLSSIFERQPLIIKNLKDLKHFGNLETLFVDSLPIDSVKIDFKNKISHLYISLNLSYFNIDSCTNLSNFEFSQVGTKKAKLNLGNLKNIRRLVLNGDVDIDELNLNQKNNLLDLSIMNTPNQKLDLQKYNSLLVLRVTSANNLKRLSVPQNIGVVILRSTLLDSLNFFKNSKISQVTLDDNSNLGKVDISGSEKILVCATKNNPKLTKILLSSNQKIDTLAGSHGGMHWQKDPWTKWVIK